MGEQHRQPLSVTLLELARDFRNEAAKYDALRATHENEARDMGTLSRDMEIAAIACERKAKQVENGS
jgi:predicted component of type VI protein secretion system